MSSSHEIIQGPLKNDGRPLNKEVTALLSHLGPQMEGRDFM
jgi:hypothetical protein